MEQNAQEPELPPDTAPPVSVTTAYTTSLLDKHNDSKSNHGILRRWSAVCDCLVLIHLEMYKIIENTHAENEHRLQSVLLQLTQFFETQKMLHRLFVDRLRSLNATFHMKDAEAYFNQAIQIDGEDFNDKRRFLHLAQAGNSFIFGGIPKFINSCVTFNLEVPLDIVRWYSLFISTWSVRHHYLANLLKHDDSPILDPGFQSFIFHPTFQKFLTGEPSFLSNSDFEHIQEMVRNINNRERGEPQVDTKESKSTRGTRGIATEKTYGNLWDDGSLRDRNDTAIRVRLLKCPHCKFLTRIKHSYFEDPEHPLTIICEKGMERNDNGGFKETPYVDIKRSRASLPLSKDRAFIRIRTHIRECMRNRGIEPDEDHKNFYGHYEPSSFGKKGRLSRSKWFKKHGTFNSTAKHD